MAHDAPAQRLARRVVVQALRRLSLDGRRRVGTARRGLVARAGAARATTPRAPPFWTAIVACAPDGRSSASCGPGEVCDQGQCRAP